MVSTPHSKSIHTKKSSKITFDKALEKLLAKLKQVQATKVVNIDIEYRRIESLKKHITSLGELEHNSQENEDLLNSLIKSCSTLLETMATVWIKKLNTALTSINKSIVNLRNLPKIIDIDKVAGEYLELLDSFLSEFGLKEDTSFAETRKLYEEKHAAFYNPIQQAVWIKQLENEEAKNLRGPVYHANIENLVAILDALVSHDKKLASKSTLSIPNTLEEIDSKASKIQSFFQYYKIVEVLPSNLQTLQKTAEIDETNPTQNTTLTSLILIKEKMELVKNQMEIVKHLLQNNDFLWQLNFSSFDLPSKEIASALFKIQRLFEANYQIPVEILKSGVDSQIVKVCDPDRDLHRAVCISNHYMRPVKPLLSECTQCTQLLEKLSELFDEVIYSSDSETAPATDEEEQVFNTPLERSPSRMSFHRP